MAVFKCKMCGGDLQVETGKTTGICDYCGTQQTLPRLDNERRLQMYERANHFRRNNDYDKAAGVYETILNEDSTDAEAYWSLVLCKYGVEYVEDPKTRKRIATCNRAQLTSILADEDYKQALANADGNQRAIYEDEARVIDKIQKGILEISNCEEPFDVFICYKETDEQGKRTRDSVIAQELYHELMKEGFKVFFARITLENVLGTAYEPYIFAALNSSKVMVVVGSKKENFNSTWVKNEWNRYLGLIKGGAKKVLIPAYRDMDAYDLPDEFSHLQAQDMKKLGFMQDLVRGVKKIIDNRAPKPISIEGEQIRGNVSNGDVVALLKRGYLFLEDGDFSQAQTYFDRILDMDPENAEAYGGLLCVELNVSKQEDLVNCSYPLTENNYYKKAVRFGAKQIEDYNNKIIERIALESKEKEYNICIQRFSELKNSNNTHSSLTFTYIEELKIIAEELRNLDYLDSTSASDACLALASEFEAVAMGLLEEEKAIQLEKDRLRAIAEEKIKRIVSKTIKYSLIACASIIVVLFIWSTISRIPPGSSAVKKEAIKMLNSVYGESKTKITDLVKNGNSYEFNFNKESEKDEIYGSGYVVVNQYKNGLFYKHDLNSEIMDRNYIPLQGISEKEVKEVLLQYSDLVFNVDITLSENFQDNKTSVHLKGTGKSTNFVVNLDTDLEFEYLAEAIDSRKWSCTNLDTILANKSPINTVDTQAVLEDMQEWFVSKGFRDFKCSKDDLKALKIIDTKFEQAHYDDIYQKASLIVNDVSIELPKYELSGSVSLSMEFYDGKWNIAKVDDAMELTPDVPTTDELLAIIQGKKLATNLGTLHIDKSKVSDMECVEFVQNGNSYIAKLSAVYSSDLFKVTGVVTAYLSWDILYGYSFEDGRFEQISSVLANDSAFKSTFTSSYFAEEDYGIGQSGIISIRFTSYNDVNNTVTANVTIGDRSLTMNGTINPYDSTVRDLSTTETFNANATVSMLVFRGLTTTLEFSNINVNLSELRFNWKKATCSGNINIKHDLIIGYPSEGFVSF